MDLCIYHGNCYDGFTAAWVVAQHRPGASFLAASYGDEAPDVTGLDVVIVDFSYPRDVLERMHAQAKSLLVLDHHKTAEAALASLPYAIFDKDRSGAGMAWDYFGGGAPCPKLVQYVEDRDLWRWVLPHSREINAWIMSFAFGFDAWTGMARTLDDPPMRQTAIAAGAALENKHNKDCHAVVQAGMNEIEVLGHKVPAVNAPFTMASDIGNILANIPGVPFSVTYYDTLLERRFSLRSTDKGLDVSEVAKHFGGGGHRNAAGFAIPMGRLPDMWRILAKATQDAITAAEAPTPEEEQFAPVEPAPKPAPKARKAKEAPANE